MTVLPFISVIVPSRDEAEFIQRCLDSIIANDYRKDRLEVLVVDGMSEDTTRAILDQYVRRYPFVRVLQNEGRITPVAFNIGIQQSRGDLILIMSAHATLGKDAITQFVKFSQAFNADNVGGILKTRPRSNSLMGHAIVCALSHEFGVGGSRFRTISKTQTEPTWTDTAAFGCYKREVFERVGIFNEQLTRNQDVEFNLRLKKAGGRTLLVPSVVIDYYPRSDYRSFCEQNFRTGLWVLLSFAYSDVIPVSWRHLVPFAFVSALVGSLLLGLLAKPFFWLLMAIVGAYAMANLVASLQVARRERNLHHLLVMPLVFLTLHISYGLGSLWGAAKLARTPQFWRRLVPSLDQARMRNADPLRSSPGSKDLPI